MMAQRKDENEIVKHTSKPVISLEKGYLALTEFTCAFKIPEKTTLSLALRELDEDNAEDKKIINAARSVIKMATYDMKQRCTLLPSGYYFANEIQKNFLLSEVPKWKKEMEDVRSDAKIAGAFLKAKTDVYFVEYQECKEFSDNAIEGVKRLFADIKNCLIGRDLRGFEHFDHKMNLDNIQFLFNTHYRAIANDFIQSARRAYIDLKNSDNPKTARVDFSNLEKHFNKFCS